jgi:hypothetical protein
VGPARMIVESLTPIPVIREQYRHLSDVTDCADDVRSLGVTLSAQYRFPLVMEPNSRKDD